MTPNYTGFLNQFILCQLEEHIPAGWGKKEQGKWFLGFHPSLPVIEVQSSNSSNLGWLLGYPIDKRGNMLKAVVIYEQEFKSSDLSGFESWLGGLGGSFAAILITPYASRFYLDSAGTLPAVFYPKSEIVASTPTLIRDAEYDESLIEIVGVPEQYKRFPFGLTSKKSVERLIPDHYLDLVTWDTCRHWPTEGTIVINHDIASTVQEIAKTITKSIEGVAREYHTYMSLTAGQDSRTLLACARDLVDGITFYTWRTPDELGTLDGAIASEITRRFNLKYEIVRYRQATEQQQKDWVERTGRCVGGRTYDYLAMEYQLNPECPILLGKGGEVGRARYYNKLGATQNTELTGEKIAKFFKLAQVPEIVNRANKWLQEFSNYDVLTTLDILHIEQGIGCLGSPQRYGNNWNVFQASPFCHRRVFELMLSLPHDYRIKQELNLDIMRTRWPELLEFPINNYRGIRGLGKNIHRLGKNIRGLAIFKGLEKAARSLRQDGSRV